MSSGKLDEKECDLTTPVGVKVISSCLVRSESPFLK